MTDLDIKLAAFATRLKKQQRGFFYDKSPGFHDLQGKFDDAEKKGGGKPMKVASIQEQAIHDALAKFGFLRREGGPDDPIGVLTHVLKNSGFGFKLPPRDKNVRSMTKGKWGPPAPIDSGDSASRGMSFGLGGQANNYSGV